jgi:predicted KAP-like P-loop ATPase
MFASDMPIKNKQQDILGRIAFAESLGKAILDYKEEDSCVLGLYGPWGSGKTSIINMTIEFIESVQNDNKPIIINFNPWNYSEQNQLTGQFFKELARVLHAKNKGKGLENAAKLLDIYAAAISPLVYIPNPQTPLAIIQRKACQSLADLLRHFANKKSLQDMKCDLNEILRRQKQKIVVIIDDIDRLNSTEIRQIFQLIKSLADFKNTIYLLAFDREVVVRALEKVQEGNGNEYLEKVVQVPFAIPAISVIEVHRFLFASIDSIIKDIPTENFDNKYWVNIYHSGIRIFFKTIRDVIRFINIFKFKHFLLKDDTNVIDLIAITAIQVFLPELHSKIRENKNMFVEGYRDRGGRQDKKQVMKNAFDEIITKTAKEYPINSITELLKELFPKIESFCGNISFGDGYESNWRKEGRICSDDNFDIYFQLGISSGQISKSEIEHIIESAEDRNQFQNKIEQFLREGKISAVLERMLDYSEVISENKIINIVSVLLDIGDSFPREDEGMWSFGNDTRVARVIYFYTKDLKDKQKCFKIFKDAILGAKNSIYTIVDAIIWLGHEHGKLTKHGPKPEEERRIDEKQLEELEGIACQKIKEWAEDGRLLKSQELLSILYRLEEWDGSITVKDYIGKITKSDDGLIEFIDKFPHRIKSQGMGDYGYNIHYEVNMKSIQHFFELESIVTRLRQIQESKSFTELSENKQKAISLILDTYNGKAKSRF